MKFCVAQSCRPHDRAIDNRAAYLEGAQIALRKSSAGKISCCDPEPVGPEGAQVF